MDQHTLWSTRPSCPTLAASSEEESSVSPLRKFMWKSLWSSTPLLLLVGCVGIWSLSLLGPRRLRYFRPFPGWSRTMIASLSWLRLRMLLSFSTELQPATSSNLKTLFWATISQFPCTEVFSILEEATSKLRSLLGQGKELYLPAPRTKCICHLFCCRKNECSSRIPSKPCQVPRLMEHTNWTSNSSTLHLALHPPARLCSQC